MKGFKYLSFLLLLPASCNNDIPVPPPVEQDSDVLHVLSVGMDEAATRSIVTTDNLKTNGSQIGVYAVNSDQTEYHPLHGGSNAAVYQCDGTNWNVVAADDSKLLRLPSGSTVNVSAFYPSTLTPVYKSKNESYVSGIHILVEDDFAASAQTDYLYAEPVTGINTANPGATFTLKHALSKLTFRVYKDATLTKVTNLSALKIIDDSYKLQAGTGKTMRLSNGTLQGLSGQSAFTLTATTEQVQEIKEKSAASTATAYCLLAPAPNVEYLSFQLTTVEADTDQKQTFLTQRTDMSSHRWTAGQHLIINIVLKGMEAIVTGLAVYDWEDYTDTNFPI